MKARFRILAAILALTTLAAPASAAAGVQLCADMGAAAAAPASGHGHAGAEASPSDPGSPPGSACPMSAAASCAAVFLPVPAGTVSPEPVEGAIGALDVDSTIDRQLTLTLFRPPKN